MNELSSPPRMLPTTQAAEGLPRLRWTNSDLDRLIDAGVLTEDDRVELIGGSWFRWRPRATGMRM